MNNEVLGKRIREARLSKKMTQSEVVGNFITRNMLSQIESGVATPSLQTLTYLSQVLEIPLSSLMEDEEMTPLERLIKAKQAYKAKRYKEVIRLIGEPSPDHPLYDEFCAILAKAYKESDEQKAKYYSKLGIYAK